MRITIEDLEALKELSDELEENHAETEKQLYDDIGKRPTYLQMISYTTQFLAEQRDVQIREHQRKIDALEETCSDYESTIQQFRELVMQLQKYVLAHFSNKCDLTFLFPRSDLEQLRTQSQTAQTESATAVSQAATVMSLNLKLQSSVQKHQVRTIDLEVKSLEAKECKELLDIVQV
jgi:dynactin 1